MLDSSRYSKRNLLKMIGATLGMSAMPTWASLAFGANTPTLSRSKRVILLELFGGNDALNTLIPFKDPLYSHYRPSLAISAHDVLRLDAEVGFNPAWRGMADLCHKGEMVVIQDVGYPDPNLSHFGSAAIWASAQHDASHGAGWVGKIVQDNRPDFGRIDADGIVLSGDQDLLAGTGIQVLALEDSKAFLQNSERPAAPLPSEQDHKALSHLYTLLRDKEAIAQRVRSKLSEHNRFDAWFSHGHYIEPLDAQASLLLWLIESGVETPLYKLSLSGFDMHSNLRGAHEGLLGKVQNTLMGLRRGLIELGVWQDTLIVVQSEFGRRATENASGGTDHGTSGPVLLVGGAVAGGVYGARSDLGDLDADGNLRFRTDFREVYSTIVQNFWRMPNNSMSQQGFSPLNISL